MSKLFTYFLVLFCWQIIIAQDISLEELQRRYTSFEYKEVIQMADELLQFGINSSDELLQVYELKGMAHYTLGEESLAKSTFEALLRVNPNYAMDQRRVSPKIVGFFNEIKINFLNGREQDKPILDSLMVLKANLLTQHDEYKKAVIKNLILPGWGQFHLDEPVKGFIYSFLGVVSTASTIILISKTNDREKDYLNETNKDLIPAKYDEYNSSFKTRNILIAGAALVWLISQIDMFFFTSEKFLQPNNYMFSNNIYEDKLQFSISIPLN